LAPRGLALLRVTAMKAAAVRGFQWLELSIRFQLNKFNCQHEP
jgi:hypothetical protein